MRDTASHSPVGRSVAPVTRQTLAPLPPTLSDGLIVGGRHHFSTQRLVLPEFDICSSSSMFEQGKCSLLCNVAVTHEKMHFYNVFTVAGLLSCEPILFVTN